MENEVYKFSLAPIQVKMAHLEKSVKKGIRFKFLEPQQSSRTDPSGYNKDKPVTLLSKVFYKHTADLFIANSLARKNPQISCELLW